MQPALEENPMSQSMIKIPIDPTNPGHVFAAVGLTELAHRITGAAKGCFDELNYNLFLSQDMPFSDLVAHIKKLELISKDPSDVNTPLSLGGMPLDWWTRAEAKDSRAGNLKTWAGRTKIGEMAKAAQSNLSVSESLFFDRNLAFSSGSKKPAALTSFDAQRSRSTLDTGYSPNELEHKIVPSPSVEFFALVGLQRAWPTKANDSHAYYTWANPLPPILLPAALSGQIDPLTGYKFSIQKDGEYSRLQPAQPFHQLTTTPLSQ